MISNRNGTTIEYNNRDLRTATYCDKVLVLHAVECTFTRSKIILGLSTRALVRAQNFL
jgi:hypothetical protein